MNHRTLEILFLVLAIAGFLIPWYFNAQFYALAEDTSIMAFIGQTVTTWPAKSIAADVSIVAITALIWMVYEGRRLKIGYWWICIPITFLVALACSFPLFLYLRQRSLRQQA